MCTTCVWYELLYELCTEPATDTQCTKCVRTLHDMCTACVLVLNVYEMYVQNHRKYKSVVVVVIRIMIRLSYE